MNSMILDWYRGKIPHGMEEEPDDEEYRKAEQECGNLFDALMDAAGPQQKKPLYALEEACSWTDSLLAEHAFVHGFRLGTRLMIELLDDDAVQG